ncbi:DUF3866 family protein [Anaerobacillus alkaliphilus]|uniref:DUF3866 family protein n=1 Tax=Anaerobacillus alkaliphilus TaxID=1548597 RepID=A0A4Q0VXJ7_9BACI|nr:DUF3866 family protein [Anaerobacillus alkaliphilus]RXJ03828.1 DUF3866 family protein [Anaerobacillus alkaliphilus]
MYIEKKVIVEGILYEDEDIQLLSTSAESKKALLYLKITPRAYVKDEVIVNSTSTSLKLGTGGMDIVTSVINSTPKVSLHPRGHIMKARYLPNQHSVLAVESQESEYHALFNEPFCLGGKKILIGELHSMMPICFWAMDYLKSDAKMTVIISDEASIPISLSSHIRTLKEEERFCTITIGQAFGGTYEAVNLPTALQFASSVLESDIILITLGPGVVGTGTTYGFSGIAQANWANVIGSLGGVPVWIPRISQSDKRDRHTGISHHTITPLLKFTKVKSVLPLPNIQGKINDKIREQVTQIAHHHDVYWIEPNTLSGLIENVLTKSPIPIKTMGRQYHDDPAFFLGVAAAMKWLLS